MEISPRDPEVWRSIISRDQYSTGEIRPEFHGLTPGRAYTISLVARSKGVESPALAREYRTLPQKPSNVSVSLIPAKDGPSTNILVEWVPPSEDEG
jgi:hypothetical protein